MTYGIGFGYMGLQPPHPKKQLDTIGGKTKSRIGSEKKKRTARVSK